MANHIKLEIILNIPESKIDKIIPETHILIY